MGAVESSNSNSNSKKSRRELHEEEEQMKLLVLAAIILLSALIVGLACVLALTQEVKLLCLCSAYAKVVRGHAGVRIDQTTN